MGNVDEKLRPARWGRGRQTFPNTSLKKTHWDNPFLQKEGIRTPATTRVDHERIMWSEVSQLQKDKYCVIPHSVGPSVVRFSDRKKGVVATGSGRRMGRE